MSQEWGTFRGAVLVAIGSRGLVGLMGFATSILLARNVSQADLGVYFLLVQTAVVLGLLYDCGTSGANQRFLSIAAARGAWQQVALLLRHTGRLAGVAILVATCLLFLTWRPIAAALHAPELVPLIWGLIGLGIGRALEELASTYFRCTGRPRTGVLILGLPRQAAMLAGLAIWAVVYGGFGLEAAVYWRTGTALVAAAGGLGLVFLHLRRQTGRTDWAAPAFGEYRHVAMTLTGHLLAAYLFTHQDLWFLGLFLDKPTVGLYGVMLQLTTLIAAMMAVVNLILPPMVSKMYDQGRHQEVEALMRRVATLSGWFGLVVLAALTLWGRDLIALVYGEQYLPGYLVLIVLAAGHTFSVGVGSPGYLLQMTGHHRTLLRVTTISLITNAVLNYIAIHTLGCIGVALATTISIFLQKILLLVAARRLTGIRTFSFFNPIPSLRGGWR